MLDQFRILKRTSVLHAVAVLGVCVVLAPSSVMAAAGDGIEGVQVGLKKKPGGQLSLTLAQGFKECTAPNTQTEYAGPACTPDPENGTAPNNWRFNDEGSAVFSAKTGETKEVSGLNPAGSTDVFIQLKAKGIADAAGPGLAEGTGQLRLTIRESRNDRVNGDMTVVDTVVSIPVGVLGGKAKLKTSLNAWRSLAGTTASPRPAVLQIVSVELLDGLGQVFAVPSLGLQ